MRDLPAELDAAQEDVKFSRKVLENAKAQLAVDLARLIEVQEAIAHEEMHGRENDETAEI
jgi:hypothetical protein